MNITAQAIMIVFAVIGLTSSAIAVYVSLTAKKIVSQFALSLSQFEVRFLKEMDDRYVRSHEHNMERNATVHEEKEYRIGTKEKIDGLTIEVYRDRDNVNVVLKDILAVLKEKK
jgi:hypothetical protein